MLNTSETQIDGHDVRVTQHAARAAAKLLVKVGRAIGPGLARMTTVSSIREVDVADIGPAVSALFEALDGDQLDQLLSEIFRHTTITMPDPKGAPMVYDLSNGAMIDLAFTGRLPLMLKVAKYSLEVNFGSFFAASGALAAFVGGGKAAARATP